MVKQCGGKKNIGTQTFLVDKKLGGRRIDMGIRTWGKKFVGSKATGVQKVVTAGTGQTTFGWTK